MFKLLKLKGALAIFAIVLLLTVCLFVSTFDAKNLKSVLKSLKNDNTIPEISENYNTFSENIEDCVRQIAKSGVVIEQSSKRVLLDENMNERCYPASTTKVLTALCVLQNLPLEKQVVVPDIAQGVEGSSIYLKAGQKITVEDLLYGMMLRSGNDASVALAVAVSGSVERFAELMNETAVDCGAVNSHFVNPNGLHDDNHYTTAYDLALICAKAYEYEPFRQIVACKKRKIVIDGEPLWIANKNKLLDMYDGANGVKTGYTKTSGRCLVGGAVRDGMQLISVVLNYNDMWNDSIRMLNSCFDQYEMVDVEKAQFMYPYAQNVIELSTQNLVSMGWKNVKYPLKKDGSERILIKN